MNCSPICRTSCTYIKKNSFFIFTIYITAFLYFLIQVKHNVHIFYLALSTSSFYCFVKACIFTLTQLFDNYLHELKLPHVETGTNRLCSLELCLSQIIATNNSNIALYVTICNKTCNFFFPYFIAYLCVFIKIKMWHRYIFLCLVIVRSDKIIY